jgi:hypothetical protein
LSSYLHMCSFLYVSFSFIVFYNFLMPLFVLMLLWTPKLQKCAQLPTINTNYFQQLPRFFSVLQHPTHCIYFLTCLLSFN